MPRPSKLVGEVPRHAGKRRGQQTVEELPHAVAAQRDLAADGLAFAHVETGDGLLGARHAGLLARDDAQVAHGGVQQLVVGSGGAHAHVHDDLLKARNLIHVVEGEILLELGHDLVGVLFLQARSSHVFLYPFDELNAGFPTLRPQPAWPEGVIAQRGAPPKRRAAFMC